MSEFGAAYAGTRERITELVVDLPEADSTVKVPACPDWSVHDLVAHVTGIAVDMTRGNVAEAGRREWTAAQIEERRDRALSEIVAEWEQAAAQVEPALAHLHPAIAGGVVGDLVTHEHDLRGAIDRPGARNSEAAAIALDSYVRWFGRRIRESGLPTIEVGAEDRTWRAGKETPTGYVRASAFELLRALTGRRTKDEIRGLEWSVDPEPYVEVFSAYGFPTEALEE